MQKGRKKLNQAGMSMVELVVVILILGILSVGGAVGINYASRMNSTSAGEKLVSLLERARVYTISANGVVTLELTKEDDTYYGKLMNGGSEVDKVALGNGSLSMKVTKAGAAEGDEDIVTPIDSGTTYVISYNKENGAFSDKYKQIEISGSETRYIQMVHTTGRSYLK